MLRRWIFLCLAILLAGAGGLAQAQEPLPVPPPGAYVTDVANLLSATERAQLEDKLARFARDKGSQVVVLIVPTTQPETIEQFSLRVVEAWQPGRKGIDDGVLLLLAMAERSMRIEVGYGLEGALPDATAKRIISDVITPHFRQEKYFAGIDAGVDALRKVIAGEALPAPRQSRSGDVPGNLESALPILFGLVFVVGGVLRAIFGRLIASGIIGGVAAFIAWWLVASLLVAGVVGVLALVVSLLADGRHGGIGGNGGIGGGGFSRRGGGGFGGGWSGGGGGFGGGGASGKW